MFLYETKVDASSGACDASAWEIFVEHTGREITNLLAGLGALLVFLLLTLIALRLSTLDVVGNQFRSIAAVSVLAGVSSAMLYSEIGYNRGDVSHVVGVGFAAMLAAAAFVICARILQRP
jgi:hypothetical protein